MAHFQIQSLSEVVGVRTPSNEFGGGDTIQPWRRKQQPTPVFLPGEFYGQRSLAGYSPLGHKESDTTELLTHTHTLGSDTNSNVSDGGGFPFQQAILGTPARYPTNQLNFDTVYPEI